MTDRRQRRRAINVLDPAFYVDPWDAYRWLRDEAPVFWDPVQKLWAISRYDDVIAVEKRRRALLVVLRLAPAPRPARRPVDDQPGRSRRTSSSATSCRAGSRPGRCAATRTHVRGVVTEILDDVAPLGECEAIEAIASRLPAIMIGDLLGYPPRAVGAGAALVGADHAARRARPRPTARRTSPHPGLGPVIQDFFEVTIPIVEERRAEPP